MNILKESITKFAKLSLGEQLLAAVLGSVVLYFIVNLVLLTPQEQKIKDFQQLNRQHQAELAMINTALADLEKDTARALAQQATDRATLDALKKQIADAAAAIKVVEV